MSKLLGGLVLVAGVGGLGWYGSSHNAKTMQAEVEVGAQSAIQGTIHPLSTQVSGRDIIVTGVADSEDEQDLILSALNDVDGRRVVLDQLKVLDTVSPFALSAAKSADGFVYSGVIPTEKDRDVLAARIGDAAQGFELKSGAPDTNWTGVVSQGLDGLDVLEEGTMSVSDDTVSLTGLALNPDAEADARGKFAELPENYTANFDITLLDDGAPFSLEMLKTAEAITSKGKFPAQVAPSDIVSGDVADIHVAAIGDDKGGFSTAAAKGVQALGQLQEGALTVLDTNVVLSGIARTPAEADAIKLSFSDLPDGYAAHTDITTLDDGTPPNFTVAYTAGEGALVDGKLPADTKANALGKALGLSAIAGDPTEGLIGEGAVAVNGLTAISSWLPELDAMTFNSNDNVLTVNAIAAPGVDVDLVEAGLSEALGAGANVAVTASSTVPDDGSLRTNQATGRSEVFTSGYWLPVLEFTSSLENCTAQSESALKADRVNFVTGSARLDAQSVRAINSVAAIVRKCLADTDLTVEIGGHTDSQGGDDLNAELSQARAESVRTALINRGVAEGAIAAKGYGETQPIADNETAEGRAANRRTALTWFEPIVNIPAAEEPIDAADTDTQVGE